MPKIGVLSKFDQTKSEVSTLPRVSLSISNVVTRLVCKVGKLLMLPRYLGNHGTQAYPIQNRIRPESSGTH